MLFKTVGNIINGTFLRRLHLTATRLGPDSREKRLGHKEKTDKVDGEVGTISESANSFEFVDENLMNQVIKNVKFKNIPIIHIKCTRNNTKITLCNGDGDILSTKTAGTEGFKNCRKGTTVAAQAVAKRTLIVAQDNEITMARMVFDGLGPGRNAAYKVFELNNFDIISLSDRTQAAEPWNKRPRKAKRI